jgi:hypothetical protein
LRRQRKVTPAQIALAWLLAQRLWIVRIPGTTKHHRPEENIGAAAVELTAGDAADMDSAVSAITVQGEVPGTSAAIGRPLIEAAADATCEQVFRTPECHGRSLSSRASFHARVFAAPDQAWREYGGG